MSGLLPPGVLALLLAAGDAALPAPSPRLELEASTVPSPPVTPDERAARERALSRVSFADAVDLTGHVEDVAGATLVVLGRRVDGEFAELQGGGRSDLVRGALVRVVGEGQADGSVRARRLELGPARDPELASRLARELAKFKEKYWKKAKRLEDPALDAYLAGIARRLTPGYVRPGEARFEVIVVRDADLNAFALPDGTIVLHSGIVARMENEAQLASVLAHEMAHVTQLHTVRAMDKATEHAILNWGSLLAAAALGVSGKGDAAQGVQLMSSAWLSAYSRAHEDEADQVGLRYLYLAGYDVREAPRVWTTFQHLYGDMTREANFFYGSHSTARDREHNLGREVWKAYEPSGLVGGDAGREEFLARTAALVRENALLDLERGNLPWAEWGLARSLAVAPDDPETHLALGRLALRRGGREGRVEAALAFRRATELAPGHARAHRELGFVLERLGDRAGARAALERYLELEPGAGDAREVRRVLDTI